MGGRLSLWPLLVENLLSASTFMNVNLCFHVDVYYLRGRLTSLLTFASRADVRIHADLFSTSTFLLESAIDNGPPGNIGHICGAIRVAEKNTAVLSGK